MSGCAPCAAAAAIAAPPSDAEGRIWAWCTTHDGATVCWAPTVDIPRSALAYVAAHGLTNPRRTVVTVDTATWPEGAPT